MTTKAELLELAVLGLVHDQPQHGYELRKQLNARLGTFRALSYGTLYPCLKRLVALGELAEQQVSADAQVPARRAKVVYSITERGEARLRQMLDEAGPASWDDDGFGVRFALFSKTSPDVRLRILEGRRSRLVERSEGAKRGLSARERIDRYTLELERHGLESVEREVRWLSELIDSERSGTRTGP